MSAIKVRVDSLVCMETTMSNRTKLNRFADGGVVLDPRRIAETIPIRMGESIETLEALRDTITAQEWKDAGAKHSVLYGIKMCIHALKQKKASTWAETIVMTREAWQAMKPPYKQDGGRYWPEGVAGNEYYFYAEDDVYNVAKPWPDQRVVFKRSEVTE